MNNNMGKSSRKRKSRKEEPTRQPKIVDHVTESDDEEISESEAFNSDDERKYGHFFNNQKKTRTIAGDNDDGDDDEHLTSDDENSSLGDDDDDDDDDDDESNDEDDGGQYMLDLLEKLDSKNNRTAVSDDKSDFQAMAKMQESEFSSSISKKGLTLDQLMEGLQGTQGYGKLQKTFKNQSGITTTPAPLARVVADRIQRKIAYKQQAKAISAWTDAVQQNRKAETLDFKPKEGADLVTRDTLVEKFEPSTAFEKELEDALIEAGQQDEEAILKKEEDALKDDLGSNQLTMEEYKKRRGQLAQIRALMFYHEQKRHQMKKIKSKKYRRIRKKQRERLKESALEAAMDEDEDLANEMKEKEEVSRIQERMTLAHKNTSRWAKRVLKRGKNVDVDTRKALSAQLKRGEDLRRKMMNVGDNEDNSDNDSGEEDLVDAARKVLSDVQGDANNDQADVKTGLFKLSFMQKGIEKQRQKAREEARKLLNELEANERDDYDEAVKDDDDVEKNDVPKKEKVASAKEMKSILDNGGFVAKSLEFGNSNSIATSAGIEIEMPTMESGEREGADTELKDNADTNCKAKKDNARLSGTSSNHVSTLNVVDINVATETRKSKSKSSAQGTKSAPPAAKVNNGEESNPWMVPDKSTTASEDISSKKNGGTTKSGTTRKGGIVDIDGAVDILDDSKRKNRDKSSSEHVNGTTELSTKEESSDKNKKITSMTQEELVQMAFAGLAEKDVVGEFQKEKAEMQARDDPSRSIQEKSKSNMDVVAGWGSWTGQGALPPPPQLNKRKRLPKKLQPPPPLKKEPKRPRKDDRKPNVIINEKRVKLMANTFMLGEIPHPYTSRAEYESAMMGGLGKEWNVTNSFKNGTRPEILTRSGKLIQPISKSAKQKQPHRAPAKF